MAAKQSQNNKALDFVLFVAGGVVTSILASYITKMLAKPTVNSVATGGTSTTGQPPAQQQQQVSQSSPYAGQNPAGSG